MNKDLFEDANDLKSACEAIMRIDYPFSKERAIVSAFYNGLEIEDDCEDDDQDSGIVNHLLGHDSISVVRDQIESLYSKSKNFWNVEVKGLTLNQRQKMSSEVTSILNSVIKDSRRFKGPWKSMCGDLALHGNGTFAFLDLEDWCPTFCRPIVPPGTSTVPSEVLHLVIPAKMGLRDLEKYYRLGKDNKESGWKTDLISSVIERIKEGYSEESGGASELDESPEDIETGKQSGGFTSNEVPVFFSYQGRPDRPGSPFDLTIILRDYISGDDESPIDDIVLFDKEEFFENSSWLHPFFLDCMIGGNSEWHRVTGLGRINYESDSDREVFLNEAIAGSKESFRRLWKRVDSGDPERVNRWISGEDRSDIIPEGLDVVELGKSTNFQHAMSMLGVLSNISDRNSNSAISNRNGRGSTNELEIQAQDRLSRNAEAVSRSIEEIYESLQPLGAEVVRRFLNTSISESDPGYDEISLFQRCCERQGISVEFLGQTDHGKFLNISVKPNRAIGDGSHSRQLQIAQNLERRFPMYGPDAQKSILRKITAMDSGDYEMAEELVPDEEVQDIDQVRAASIENEQIKTSSILGEAIPIRDEDQDEVHVFFHMKEMQVMIRRGQINPNYWTPQQTIEFRGFGQHIMAHISKLIASDQTRSSGIRLQEQLKQLAQASEQLVSIADKKARESENPIDPVDREKLLMDREKLKLDQEKHAAIIHDRNVKNNQKRMKIELENSQELEGDE